MTTGAILAGLGLMMGFLRAHGKAQSSTPSNPSYILKMDMSDFRNTYILGL